MNVYSGEGIIGGEQIIGIWIFTPLPWKSHHWLKTRWKQKIFWRHIARIVNAVQYQRKKERLLYVQGVPFVKADNWALRRWAPGPKIPGGPLSRGPSF